MLILALDTSGETCSVALSGGDAGDRIFSEYSFRHERHLTERLPEILQFILRDAGFALSDVESFAVGLGPGSFTGVRIGVTMTKTFALATGKPIVGVSSLDAVAAAFCTISDEPRIVAVPTRRTDSIAAFYRPGEIVPIASPETFPNAEIIAQGKSLTGAGRILLAGEAAEIILAATPESERENIQTFFVSPSAAQIARLAAPRFLRNDLDAADSLIPLYVAPPPTG